MIRFDVFGRFLVGVEPLEVGWKPYFLGNEGKRRDADFVIPAVTPSATRGMFHSRPTLFMDPYPVTAKAPP